MSSRHYVGIGLAVVIVLFVYVTITNRSDIAILAKGVTEWRQERPPNIMPHTGVRPSTRADSTDVDLMKIKRQRDTVSRKMNDIRKQLAQAECQMKEKKGVSVSGGWCESQSKEDGGQHVTDRQLAAALAEFLKDKTVASFGDGPGRYKALLDETKKLQRYDAYDGAPFCEKTSEGRVKFLDLSLQQYGLPLYDFVMSLEVAEHIPAQFESIYVDNIVRHAKEGVIISWAKIGQGGFQHVNNKAFSDVKALFDKLGFVHDEAASQGLKNSASAPWLKNNINVFRRVTQDSISDLYI